MKNNKIKKIHNIKYALITMISMLALMLGAFDAFALEDAVEDYKALSITFIVIDIVLFLILYFMIKIFRSYRNKVNVEKNLQALTFGIFLAYTKNLLIILIVICAVLFLTICEFAYLIRESKKELKDLKDKAIAHSKEIEEMLAKGNVSYVMTVEAWYDIEKGNCDHEESLGLSAVTYLNTEIAKEEKAAVKDDARMGALKKLLEEYFVEVNKKIV